MPTLVRHCFALAVFNVVLVIAVAEAQACTCSGFDKPPACEVYGKHDVAFVGRIIEAGRQGGDARVLIQRGLKGVAVGEVLLRNDDAGAGCGYPFQQGKQYVIFAQRNSDGDIEIPPCARDIWEIGDRDFQDAMTFAQSLANPPTGGWIYGDVALIEPAFTVDGADERRRPVEGAVVFLEGPDVQRRTTTVKGRFEFHGLPRGGYEVSVHMPQGLPAAWDMRIPEGATNEGLVLSRALRSSRTITIDHDRACGYASFGGVIDGRIAGSVIKNDGSPAQDVQVEVVPEGTDTRRTLYFTSATSRTDASGKFEIPGLPVGRYVVGVNLKDIVTQAMPYASVVHKSPSGENIVELGAAERIELPPFRLPEPRPRWPVSGTIETPNDRPIGRVLIVAREFDRTESAGQIASSPVDANRQFSVALFEGRTYIVEAREPDLRGWNEETDAPYPPVASAAVKITVNGPREGLRLILRPRTGTAAAGRDY